jgi:phosphoglycolate phosphatase-like HAD superfamily hydrolase
MSMIFSHLIRRLVMGLAVAAGLSLTGSLPTFAQSDPLPSWNEGAVKTSILDFVARITKSGGSDFVPPESRIATFDNDGTLWAEQPIYFQFAFALDEVKRLAPQHPEWKGREPFKSVLAGNPKAVLATGEKGLAQIMAVTHAGMTEDAFADAVRNWFATTRHPTMACPYDQLIYQPQLELLAFLRANGFKTFIASGGGVEFMRVFAERSYGIPPEQVIGSSGEVKFEIGADGKPVLLKMAKMEFIDDGPGKPVGINRFIGRRPIPAFGNSDGDQQMLEYTASGDGPRLALLLHHTDAVREWAYDRHSPIGKLDKALDEATERGWQVVDMKSDWKVVFPAQK